MIDAINACSLARLPAQASRQCIATHQGPAGNLVGQRRIRLTIRLGLCIRRHGDRALANRQIGRNKDHIIISIGQRATDRISARQFSGRPAQASRQAVCAHQSSGGNRVSQRGIRRPIYLTPGICLDRQRHLADIKRFILATNIIGIYRSGGDFILTYDIRRGCARPINRRAETHITITKSAYTDLATLGSETLEITVIS